MPGLSRRQLLRWMGSGAGVAVVANAAPRMASAATGGVGSTPAAEFDAAVATEWFDLARVLVQRTPGYSPPVASRAFGCAGVALYEALVPGMRGRRSLAGLLNDLAPTPATGRNVAYHWPTVANRVLAQAFRSLIPVSQATLHEAISTLEQRYAEGFQVSVPRGIYNRSVDRGSEVAAAIDGWARGDGGHEGYLRNFPTDYTPPQGPGLWSPTPPAFQRALQPRWGANRCLALKSVDDCAPGPPPPFSTSGGSMFLAEAREVYETVNNLADDQLAIARFWSDDPGLTATPPGHSVSILTQVLRSTGASLALASEAYARLGIAVADSFIACWRVKYQYSLLRPITYVRAQIDPTWGDPSGQHPLPLTTPPFPEFPSGHSVQSAAAAVVLTELFGAQPFTDHTHDGRGLPSRHFDSFHAAAEEAAISRLYGGIHFRSAIERGLEQGRCIGAGVSALPLRL